MRWLRWSAGALVVLWSLTALAEEAPIFFRIGSGAAGGTYFPIAAALAAAISAPPGARACARGGRCGVPNLIAVVQSSEGSVANVEDVASGRIESGLAQADVAAAALAGTGPFGGEKPIRDLRALASLFSEQLHFVAATGRPIRSVGDLKGRSVSVGLPSSGILVGARAVLHAAGLSLSRDIRPLKIGLADSAARIADGTADALLAMVAYQNDSVAGLLSSGEAHLLPIAGKVRDRLIAAEPLYRPDRIPAGAYPGLDHDVETVSVRAIWVVRADLPEELAHDIVKALWGPASRALLDQGHERGREIRLEDALAALSVPLHPGAARYYREAGLLSQHSAGDRDAGKAPADRPAAGTDAAGGISAR